MAARTHGHWRYRPAIGSGAGPVLLAALSLMLACSVGCGRPQRSWTPPVDPDSLSDAAFLHYLASAPTVTVEEGVRGVLLLRGQTDRWPTFAQRETELLRVGALKAEWKLSPSDTLDMGTLAFILRTLCGLPRSLGEEVAERTGLGKRRYALRTCFAAGLLPESNSTRPVRGGEFVAALAMAEEYVAPDPKYFPPIEDPVDP